MLQEKQGSLLNPECLLIFLLEICMRYPARLISALSVVLMLTPAVNAQITLRDAIYLYSQDFYAGGTKRIIGKDCDVFQLVLDVDQGSIGIKMAQYNSGESVNYYDYPDAIQSSTNMFSYMLYGAQDTKVFKFDGNGGKVDKVGTGTVFGYCFSANPNANVYLAE